MSAARRRGGRRSPEPVLVPVSHFGGRLDNDSRTSVFIGEMQQTIAVNAAVPEPLVAPESRFFQALSYQNATTGYLPPHA